jgi:tRNA (cytidine/uridine-2'-O-)-methyltransferase
MLALALYEPDMPGNAGAAIRLCACLGAGLHIIGPCGFVWDERRMQRTVMDYYQLISVQRHRDWPAFLDHVEGRLVLLTTQAGTAYTSFAFDNNDILIAGSESDGVPDDIHLQADQRLAIEMPGGGRSLNVVNALSMVAGEAMRQLGQFTVDSGQ